MAEAAQPTTDGPPEAAGATVGYVVAEAAAKLAASDAAAALEEAAAGSSEGCADSAEPAQGDVAGELGALPETTQPEFGAEDPATYIEDVMSFLVQQTAVALAYRRKEQTSRAIKEMQRALAVCERLEQGHPALAVEVARARLNLSAMLSRGSRHRAALAAIKDAQHSLETVLAWASACGSDDPGVTTIAEQARALQCAALLAEAIELEPFPQGPQASQASKVPEALQAPQSSKELEAGAAAAADSSSRPRQLYREAHALAAERLPAAHPLAALAQRLGGECAVCAPGSGACGLSLPPLHEVNAAPRLGVPVRRSPTAAPHLGPVPPHHGSPMPVPSSPGPPQASAAPGQKACVDFVSPPTGSVSRRATNAALRPSGLLARGERHDLFSDFLRDVEAEKEARRGARDSWQDDAKRRLDQVHRVTRLQLELTDDENLKDKRYTAAGHKIFMKSLSKINKSRSDPALVNEAKKVRDCPEVLLIRKLNRQLYVKPPTAEPVKVEVKKVAPAGLSEQMAALFKRSFKGEV